MHDILCLIWPQNSDEQTIYIFCEFAQILALFFNSALTGTMLSTANTSLFKNMS